MAVKVVYAITCHRVTNPLVHTVNYLASFEDNIILIHVDGKSDLNDFLKLEKSNVYLIPDRAQVTWGDKSFTNAIIKLMEYSLKFEYDFFFLLSGDDIPLKTNEKLKQFLTQHYEYNFLDFDPSSDDNHIYERVTYSHPIQYYDRSNSIKTLIIRRFFKISRNIFYKNKLFTENSYRMPKLYKGSNWFSLKKEAIEYILEYINKNQWFLDVFEKSFASDEIVFHSIIMTNPDFKIFRKLESPDLALRYIDWQSGPEYPKVLNNQDINKMKNSPSFFARKVKPDATKEFMEQFLISSE